MSFAWLAKQWGWKVKSDEHLIKVCGEIDEALQNLIALADRFQLTLIAANLELTRDAVAQQLLETAPLTFRDHDGTSSGMTGKKN